jgi:holo-[acyl-carrier protein] synthase
MVRDEISKICGVGVDVCEMVRVQKLYDEHAERLVRRVCNAHELAARPALRTDPAALARRWALKEAVAKALGTGIGGALSFGDITIDHTPAGQPLARVRGHEDKVFLVSVSDDAGVAMACCVVTAA